jgi:hypothetical protein
VLTITYKDGEKTVVITPETAIVRFESGELPELNDGAKIVATVLERPDGSRENLHATVAPWQIWASARLLWTRISDPGDTPIDLTRASAGSQTYGAFL